ncbi:hypothetical protein Rhe02_02830 [Rhizocola hellebori]|uniref:Ricin B lectin domain-containing protein n=1 Tax=Rhizocola hellebori TaxID=1392758 RepID=A0A8J3VD71_9ACTN|nr:RICIN domain-containing protein [Rhizocola hellebori]GIH02216.1 hypothetical protein Rhe02_02830 [Rhizocola hellebori]
MSSGAAGNAYGHGGAAGSGTLRLVFFTPAQLWILTSLGGNDYQFANVYTTGCLDAHGPNADRTVVDTWPCSRISNQRWTVTPHKMVSAVGGRCLDIAAGSLEAGAPAQIYHCTNDNWAQKFTVYFVTF